MSSDSASTTTNAQIVASLDELESMRQRQLQRSALWSAAAIVAFVVALALLSYMVARKAEEVAALNKAAREMQTRMDALAIAKKSVEGDIEELNGSKRILELRVIELRSEVATLEKRNQVLAAVEPEEVKKAADRQQDLSPGTAQMLPRVYLIADQRNPAKAKRIVEQLAASPFLVVRTNLVARRRPEKRTVVLYYRQQEVPQAQRLAAWLTERGEPATAQFKLVDERNRGRPFHFDLIVGSPG